ncbi:hypothetical protein N1851_025496 [Merluccius polli]|uniref:Uncharacterized protein n=1 Tax=Merluccius polli TaxID=89951 RepID=A0AA47NUU9_MERPO|nr:hypothetical protein N1851_025496 [Merluccius polli]
MIRRYIKSQLQGRTGDLLPTDWGQSTRPLPPRLLQLAPGWTPCLRHQALCSASRPRQRDSCSTCRSRPHVTPLFRDLQRLPVAARITFKTTVPTYKAVNGTAPTHLRALVRPHAPARALRATTSAGRYRHP